jgi:hypothetical protein
MTSSFGIDFGPDAISSIYFGAAPITDIYFGKQLVWSPPINTVFSLFGELFDWFIDLVDAIETGLSGVSGNILAIGNTLYNGIGTVIGQVVSFIPNTTSLGTAISGLTSGTTSLGALIAQIPDDLDTDVCAAISDASGDLQSILSGIASGLTGFINGLPSIGGIVTTLEDILSGNTENPLSTITSIVGTNSLSTALGQALGVLANDTGGLSNPANFITNSTGTVAGLLTCGEYQPSGSSAGPLSFPIVSGGDVLTGIPSGLATILMPTGLVSLPTQTSFARHQTQTATADGFVETSPGTVGDPGYVTQVFRRYDNSGSAASGVGIDMRSSILSIVGRVGSVDTLVAPALGSFKAGDNIRLVQSGTTHTLWKNGLALGQFVDTPGTYPSGAGNRSVGMTMQCAQLQQGPSRYSPALRYVRAA